MNFLLFLMLLASPVSAQTTPRADAGAAWRRHGIHRIFYWPNREAIKAFAAQDIERAHFLPRVREFLINPDELVRHYDATSAP
jgi:hypothetical protein